MLPGHLQRRIILKKHLPQCIETTRESVSDSTVVERNSELEYITG
jgi:hypothetical protein